MSKALILPEATWLKINQRIKLEYPNSVFLIRNKRKTVLGFTVRTHEEWIPMDHGAKDIRHGIGKYVRNIHLDFYNEPKRTMFLLKYSNIINASCGVDTEVF